MARYLAADQRRLNLVIVKVYLSSSTIAGQNVCTFQTSRIGGFCGWSSGSMMNGSTCRLA